MNDFYNKNADFKDYVDKYAKKTHISVDEALTHFVVREAYEYYLAESKNVRIIVDDK